MILVLFSYQKEAITFEKTTFLKKEEQLGKYSSFVYLRH